MISTNQTQGLGPSQPVAGQSLRERFCETSVAQEELKDWPTGTV